MKKFLGLTFVLLLLIGFSSSVNAAQYTYQDMYIYWPTWDNGTLDDFDDVIGGPEIYSLTVTTDTNDNLTSIDVNMDRTPIQGDYVPDSLFIDVDNDLNWDYFSAYNTTASKQYLYKVNQTVSRLEGVNNSSYIMSTASSPSYREDHPVGIKTQYMDSPVTIFSAWDGTKLMWSYDFSNFSGIILGSDEDWTIGFTVDCANDVFLTPVPEPASLILIGSGLLLFAGLGRKKFFKRS